MRSLLFIAAIAFFFLPGLENTEGSLDGFTEKAKSFIEEDVATEENKEKLAEEGNKFFSSFKEIISNLLNQSSELNTVSGENTKATIERVIDGDTVHIELDGRSETVRLLLVDTPETVHPSLPVQPFGPEASAFAKEILTEGKEVFIEFDGPKRDKYDRLLAYIWVDGQLPTELKTQWLVRTSF